MVGTEKKSMSSWASDGKAVVRKAPIRYMPAFLLTSGVAASCQLYERPFGSKYGIRVA